MNLAFRDIRYNLGRFVFTAAGLGLLLMIVMGMTGIYNGLIEDATGLVDKTGADLWVVQRDTRGPFAEISRVPRSLEDRVLAVPGIARSRAFVSHTIQRQYQGKPLRIVVQGLSWPQDNGDWLPLVAGRPLQAAHYEMIVDRSLGLRLGQPLPLGRDVYTVVGLTRGMVGNAGDGMIMQQAILLGMLGYAAGYFVGQFVFPYFPRRVSLTGPDMLVIAGVVLGIAVLASLVGIRKAIKVEPNTVLA